MIDRFDPSMLSVAEMIAHGADSVSTSCGRCSHLGRALITMLPPETTLAKIAELMVCLDCGSANVHIKPVWPDGGPIGGEA